MSSRRRRGRDRSSTGRIASAMAVVTGSLNASTLSPAGGAVPAAVSTSGPTVYVAGFTGQAGAGVGSVIPIAASTNTVGPAISVGSPQAKAIAIAPDGKTVYVVDDAAGAVIPIDVATRRAGTPIHVFPASSAQDVIIDNVAITPDGITAYVAQVYEGNHTGNRVTPVNLATNTAGTPIVVGEGPSSVAITPDGKTAYVVASTDGSVTPIATATNQPGARIPIGFGADSIAITPDGKTAYVAVNGSAGAKLGNKVTPITIATNKAGKPIKVGKDPADIAITPDGKTAYTANIGGGTLTPITIATNKPRPAIKVGGCPQAVAITPDGKTVYVTGLCSSAVATVSTATDKVGKSINVTGGRTLAKVAISPDEAPEAVLSVVPAAVGSGLATQFSAVGSIAPSSPIVSYAWDFGDGTTLVTPEPTTSHVYTSASTYSATVTETDAVGTSTTQVFTGQTMTRNGGPSAVAAASVVIVSCMTNQTCDATVSAGKSASTPPQSIRATGMPTDPSGTLQVALAPAKLVCPKVDPAVAPVADVTNTGFATTTALTITTTLRNTIRPSSHQVCYSSDVAFRSQSSPTVATAGTALLLDCTDTANVAPCVVSSSQVGPDVVVTFLIPGGDPRFHVVAPPHARIGFLNLPKGARQKPYSATLTAEDGTPPYAWKVVSRKKLPPGLRLNGSTGAITGKPTKKGLYTFTVQASDSQVPPEAVKLSMSITVK